MTDYQTMRKAEHKKALDRVDLMIGGLAPLASLPLGSTALETALKHLAVSSRALLEDVRAEMVAEFDGK